MKRQLDVLIVEDDDEVREILRELLLLEGYSVGVAVDGRAALDWLAQELPKVILTDLNMPSVDGWDLLRALRTDARLAAVPVLIMTSDEHVPSGYPLLKKPFASRALLAFLAAAGVKSPSEAAAPALSPPPTDDSDESSD